ncbi:hypothetical protein MPTK1_7g09410 [Marchantia polymorpha subsp. ruderalis]|nr:hypothetical protein MARPO_0068s0094 [Marchantia polymorpha]BBN16803.1 hypothetical protein Mp_7g09410 [Marchantia polymorpha subsp. ruderalis]|eukprot:PTQ35886.1 hypothetical protein MARPO_0068s0094 [Marchantia polymorpha]
MAQSGLPRGRSWTAGAPAAGGSGAGGAAFAASSRWLRNERYRELNQLEEEAKRNMKEIKLMEKEIREQAAKLEMLKKLDAKRVERISDLSRVLETEENVEGKRKGGGEGGVDVDDGKQQASEGLQEQLMRLEQERASILSTMEQTKVALEQKEKELDRLAGHHKGLCDQIGKEEKALQAAELEESLQQSVAVHQEMRSLSEDLGRLRGLMDGLPSVPDQFKQNPMRPVKPRGTYHAVTNRGNRSVARNNHESIPAPEQGRSSAGHALPFTGRNKVPVEFEEREGSNRKRHKNSSFEQELQRLHEQRERLEQEAHEKQMLLESVARFSNQSRDAESGIGMYSRKLVGTSQPILSPSSVFEGFKDTPSLGPPRPATTDSSSASSDASSEDTTVEKPENGAVNSAAKRLNFGDSSLKKPDTTMLHPVGTGKSCISMESNSDCVSERDDDMSKDHFGSVAVEDGSVGSCTDITEEQGFPENGLKGGCSPEEGETKDFLQGESVVEGIEEEELTTGSGINEIQRLEEEVGSWGYGETPRILPTEELLPSEIRAAETPGTLIYHEEPGEGVVEEESLSARCHKIRRSLEFIFDSKNIEGARGSLETCLHPAVPSSQSHLEEEESFQVSILKSFQTEEGNQPRELYAKIGDEDEFRVGRREASANVGDDNDFQIWKQNAETHIRELSSQFSLLHQKVEREVELQDELRKQQHLEQSSATTEQLTKQVNSFGDEITELRQSMLQLQQKLLKEVESRSSAEHSIEHFRSICTDQSSKLEHMESRVSILANELEQQLQLKAELEGKLDKEAQERLKVEVRLKDLSHAVLLTASTRERGEEAVEELVEKQKILLIDQLKEAEKLRTVAEVRVCTLDKQVEQLEMVCDVSQNIQEILKFQDKALKLGLQTLVQVLMLAFGVVTLYSRVAEAIKGSLIPT